MSCATDPYATDPYATGSIRKGSVRRGGLRHGSVSDGSTHVVDVMVRCIHISVCVISGFVAMHFQLNCSESLDFLCYRFLRYR